MDCKCDYQIAFETQKDHDEFGRRIKNIKYPIRTKKWYKALRKVLNGLKFTSIKSRCITPSSGEGIAVVIDLEEWQRRCDREIL